MIGLGLKLQVNPAINNVIDNLLTELVQEQPIMKTLLVQMQH